MPPLLLGGIDTAATLGFNLTDEGGARAAMVNIPQEVEIPGVPGVIFSGPFIVRLREYRIRGYLDGASKAAVQANLLKLQALCGDGNEVAVVFGDWATVQLPSVCVEMPGKNYPVNSRGNSQNEIPFYVEMLFRADNPFWQDITPQAINFTSTHTNMPQGTAPGFPVLTSPVGALTTPQLKGWDHNDVELWSCTLASLGAGEQYRITTAPGVMTIEKFAGGVWVVSDGSKTAGVFPKILSSNGVAYQTSAWPKLSASTGTWVSTYPRQWR